LALLACVLCGLYVVRAAPDRAGAAKSAVSAGAVPSPAAKPDVESPLRYLAVGGGATPEYTEVSLEQDLALAQKTLPGPGSVLFAGGSESVSVRELPETTTTTTTRQPTLLAQLGDLFDPRAARGSRYRAPRLSAQIASVANFETNLTLAARSGTAPLLLYVAAHGLQGETPRDNRVELWASEPITVARMDELLTGATRPVRLVIASCYSGGFAELAFAHADPERGPASGERCGVFAGTWDRQTSGCDPNPDRRAQEGYSLHLLHALRGEDREGAVLPPRTLDLNGDGKVGLLEAHTRARIASHSIDVPTTTSERYLREVQHEKSAPALQLLPEDAAVIKQLGARLGLKTTAAVDQRYAELSRRLDELEDEQDAAEQELEHARAQLAAALLARWPVLQDAFHAEFASTLMHAAADVDAVLNHSAVAESYQRARADADAVAERVNVLEVEEAEVLRLVRAHETLGLAGALAARGGRELARYRALLTCERSVP